MKFQLSRAKIFSWTFLALGIASAIFIAAASVNYSKLYPALSHLDVGVSAISFGNGLTAQIFVSNPVDYTGLSAASAGIQLYFLSGNSSLYQNSTITDSIYFNTRIAPSENTTLSWTLRLSTVQTSALTNFYQTHNQNVVVHYSLSLDVASFLQGEAGSATYDKAGQIPLIVQP